MASVTGVSASATGREEEGTFGRRFACVHVNWCTLTMCVRVPPPSLIILVSASRCVGVIFVCCFIAGAPLCARASRTANIHAIDRARTTAGTVWILSFDSRPGRSAVLSYSTRVLQCMANPLPDRLLETHLRTCTQSEGRASKEQGFAIEQCGDPPRSNVVGIPTPW